MYGTAATIEPVRQESQAANRHEPSRVVELFMAGDIEHAKQVVRVFCKDCPCCVTITPTDYIYRGGQEAGFVIGFRNYPRFPSDSYSLRTAAADLGDRLRDELGQDSYMIVDHSGMTTWSTVRDYY